MSTRASLVVASLCALALVVAGASCASPGDTITLGGGDASPPPSFTNPSDGGDASLDAPSQALFCVGTLCPYPYQTCTDQNGAAGYRCGSSSLTDDANCGGCGNVCPQSFLGLNMESHCVQGKCQSQCINLQPELNDFQDCNGIVDDGCELDIANDPLNCGACGLKCPNNPDGTPGICSNHKCGCPAGKSYCSGLGCVDLASDGNNCGMCGNKCPAVTGAAPPNADFGCVGGTCGVLACDTGFADCNSNLKDGCETDIVSNANCGACGKACPSGETCIIADDQSVRCACAAPLSLCGNECVDLTSDLANCGVCGHKCPGPPADPNFNLGSSTVPTCDLGFCGLGCVEGWADCDGDGRLRRRDKWARRGSGRSRVPQQLLRPAAGSAAQGAPPRPG